MPSVKNDDSTSGTEHRDHLSTLVVTRKTVFHAYDNNLQGFNRKTRELIKVYNGHNSFVTCIQYYNFILYTGAQDSYIISWNLKTGQQLNRYAGHQGPVTSLVISEGGPGGSTKDSLFSSAWDGTVRCWSLMSGRHKMSYTVGTEPVEVFEVIGPRIYAGSGDTFRVFDARSGQTLYTFNQCPETIHHAMAFDEDTGKLIVGGSTLSVWDLLTLSEKSRPKVLAEYTVETPPRDDNASSSDEEIYDDDRKVDVSLEAKYPTRVSHIVLGEGLFWTGHANGAVRSWEERTFKPLHDRMTIHRGPITCMLLYKKKLCTGSTDRSVCVWDIEDGHCTHVLRGHKGAVSCIRKFRGILFTSSFDGDIRTWDLNRDMVYTGIYKGSAADITSLYQDGAERLWQANTIGHATLWNCIEARMQLEIKAFEMPCSKIIASDDRVIVSAGDAVNIYSMRALIGQEDAEQDDDLFLLRPKDFATLSFPGVVTDMIWFAADVIVVATDIDILVVTLTTLVTRAFNQRAQAAHAKRGAISVARSTNELISVSAASTLMCFWSVNDGKLRRSVDMEQTASNICVGSFSPNILHGRRFWKRGLRIGKDAIVDVVCVALGHIDDEEQAPQVARVYNLQNMEVLWNFEFHTNTISDLVVSNGWLYCASKDESVSVWSLQSGHLYHVIRDHDMGVNAIALNYRDNILHHSSYKVVGTDLSLLTRWGMNIKYLIGCGSGGLFGKPVEEEEIELERGRIKRMETLQDLVIKQETGGAEPRRLTIQRPSTVGGSVDGDPDINVGDPVVDVREFDSKWSMRKKVVNAFFNMIVLGYLMFTVEVLQLASFAFTIGQGLREFNHKVVDFDYSEESPFNDMRGWNKFMQFMQSFYFEGDFRIKMFLASLAVMSLWAVLIAQEGLEWRRFLHPTNRFVNRTWRFARFITKWMSVPVFMPVFQTFALSFSCSNVDIGWVWDVDPDVKCWRDNHIFYMLASSVLMIAYILPVLRLVRAGTRLDNIEMEGNPLDWRSDKQEINHIHTFSPASTVPDLVQVFAKMALVVCAFTMNNSPRVQAVISACIIFIVLLVHCVYPPYFSWKMTRVRTAAMIGVFWCYVSALFGWYDSPSSDIAEILLAVTAFVVLMGYYVPLLLEGALWWYERPIPANYTNEDRVVRHGRMSMKASSMYRERVKEYTSLLPPLESSRVGRMSARGAASVSSSTRTMDTRKDTSNIQMQALPKSGAQAPFTKNSMEGALK